MTNLNKVSAYSLKSSQKTLYANSRVLNINNRFQGLPQNILSPAFTGAVPHLALVGDIIPYGLLKKTHKLFDSINDAKNVLLRYKSVLSTTLNIEEDCLTALDSSTKIWNLFYKREDQTSIGAYKVRGALYQATKILKENPTGNLNFFAASTGNHALGVLKSAEALKLANVTICVPENIALFKKEKLERRILELNSKGINAKLLVKGEHFEQTNKLAQELVKQGEHNFYIDPYNNHNAVAGQGTIGLELLSQLNGRFAGNNSVENLTVVVPIGGGGLISGVSCALKEGIRNFDNLKNLKLEIVGVKLAGLNSLYGDAIKVEKFGTHNQDIISGLVTKQFKISDIDMKKGMNFVNDDIGARVESASAGTLKPILEGMVRPSEKNVVVCILSGGNVLG